MLMVKDGNQYSLVGGYVDNTIKTIVGNTQISSESETQVTKSDVIEKTILKEFSSKTGTSFPQSLTSKYLMYIPTSYNISEKIRKESGIPEDEKFGSIMAILMIISITLTLIRILQECNKNKKTDQLSATDKYNLYGSEIKSYSIKRGWFTKLRIKKVIRKQMSSDQYKKYGSALLDSVLNTGENLKDDEVITLVEAANV
jgi:hypothetical protein